MVEAVVEHDYEAQEQDELSLKKGDIICNITIKAGGWWEGTLQRIGKRGMFPDNFVKVLGGGEKKSTDSSQGQSNNKSGRKCKVLFSYTASVDDELDLNVGDIIDITGEVEEGWWRGKLKNRVGVFPSNFVTLISDTNDNTTTNDSLKKSKVIEETTKLISEEIKDASSVTMSKSKENIASETSENLPALPPKPIKEMCKVLYQYRAANDDELTLEEGDIINIITKDVQDPGWWKGELKGKIGVFPDNFVKIITPVDEVKPDRPAKVTKGKDSITKSSSSASVYSTSSTAVSRKFSDSIRPTVSVKPLLPPPTLKKPTLSPVEGKQASRLSTGDITETISVTKPSMIKQQEQEKQAAKHSETPTSGNRGSMINSISSSGVSSKQVPGGTSETKWTVLESNDTTDGMSWSRQSYSVTSSSSSNVISSSSSVTSSSIMTSSSSHMNALGNNTSENLDLDLVGRSDMLTHLTASRAKVPKRRPPSSLLSREDSRESDGETMVNGNVDPPPPVQEKQANSKQPPWVEELKLNQAKKSQGGGKTRVLISSNESATSSTSSHSTTSTSMQSNSEISRVALRQVPITAQRPLSLQPGSTHRLSGGEQQSPESTITLTFLQWNQLCDKVSKLESDLEEQSREFSRTIKELTDTIEQQVQKQKKMMNDLERLRELSRI